jgi:asparagine synthase (glutamine-hydrolysing)
MCGIAGYYSTNREPVPASPIEPMLTSIRHRGPDGFGIYASDQCVLGHARLSIIDLEGGSQPMFNEDSRFAVTFNGEIYNYLEIREDLHARGHIFSTRSDTEVILHAFEEWGIECPNHFNGQFAFVIFDALEKSLFLCRDRFGVRPLYYAWGKNRFFFASEVKAILASGEIPPVLSKEGLHQIFTLWTNVSPRTPFANIFELPPSHTMTVSANLHSVTRYWDLPVDQENELSGEEYLEGILHYLDRSIRLRLRADVPVGAYLSGGLDSAITTTLVKQWTDTPLKTFSLEFEDPRFDESEYQKEMVRFLGTDHSAIRCGPKDIVENFEDTLNAVEKPILRAAPVPMFLLSRLVRAQGYKVVITGEGADEFFLGYDIFKEVKTREFCSRQAGSRYRPMLFRKLYPYLFTDRKTARFQEAFFLRHFKETDDPFYGHRLRWDLTRRISDFYSPGMTEIARGSPEKELLGKFPAYFSSMSALDRTQRVEIHTLLSGYLLSSQGDRVGMAHSVEGRYAFLDHELVEFASRIPSWKKMPGLMEKHLLKRIGDSILPPAILKRHKFPYRAPDIDSFLGCPEGRRYLREALENTEVEKAGIFDAGKLSKLVEKVKNDPPGKVGTGDNLVLMAALSSQVFSRNFIQRDAGREPFTGTDKVKFMSERGKHVVK